MLVYLGIKLSSFTLQRIIAKTFPWVSKKSLELDFKTLGTLRGELNTFCITKSSNPLGASGGVLQSECAMSPGGHVFNTRSPAYDAILRSG